MSESARPINNNKVKKVRTMQCREAYMGLRLHRTRSILHKTMFGTNN